MDNDIKNINLNIHDFTNEQLYDLLELSENDPNIAYKINALMDKLKQEKNTGHILPFLEEAKKRLVPTLSDKTIKDDLITNPNPLNNPIPVGSSSIPGIKSKYTKSTLTTILSLNTLFRSNYFNTTPNNYTVKFPSAFRNVISMKLSSIELVNSWYNITAEFGTHTFKYRINDTDYEVKINSGNPDAKTVVKEINDSITQTSYLTPTIVQEPNGTLGILLNSGQVVAGATPEEAVEAGRALGFTPGLNFMSIQKTAENEWMLYGTGTSSGAGGENVYRVNPNASLTGFSASFNETTARTSFKHDNNIDFQLDFSNPTLENPIPMFSLGWMMGFRNQSYQGHSEYISESIINLAGPTYVYVCIEDFQTSINDTVVGIFNNSLLSRKILARLPVNSGSNTVIFDNASNDIFKPRDYFGPVNLEKLKITILDQYGNVLNLNDIDYSLSLELTILHSI